MPTRRLAAEVAAAHEFPHAAHAGLLPHTHALLVGGSRRRRRGRHHAHQQPQPCRVPGREAAHGRRRRGGQGVHRPRGGRVAPTLPPPSAVPAKTADLMTAVPRCSRSERVDVGCHPQREPARGGGPALRRRSPSTWRDLLRDLGVEVCEINNAEDPTFDGLHPEPIPPWVDRCIAKVPELGYDAGFINDGDADRIGAVDEHGNFVNPHRIITLLVSHLAEDKGQHRARRVHHHRIGHARAPVQAPGLGADQHAGWLQVDLRRDGEGRCYAGRRRVRRHRHTQRTSWSATACSWLCFCAETMAQRGMSLGQLVDDMFEKVGKLEFERRGLSITDAQMAGFRVEHRARATRPPRCAGSRWWTWTAATA